MPAVFHDPDECFANPRLAAISDVIEGARVDLDLYMSAVADFAADRVLDVGCGTGTLSTALAAGGCDVIGLDPAAASLAVARTKPNADRVRWVHGNVLDLPPNLHADLAVVTGNVAQVFVTDDQWSDHRANLSRHHLPGGEEVDYWVDVDEIRDAPDRPGREMVFVARARR